MKLLLSARPAYGHVYPMMPLARAARAEGHDVEFATAGAFVSKLEGLGFATHDVGLTIHEAHARLAASLSLESDRIPRGADGRPDPEVGAQFFVDVIADRTAADLAVVLPKVKPDVVVYDQYDFGAAVVAHVAGLPAVGHAVSPRLPDEIMAMFAGDRLDRLWADHGASLGSLDVFIGDAYLDIIPAMLQQPSFLSNPARIPMRSIPFVEPGAAFPAWVAGTRRPLVYLTLGTIVASDEVLRPVIEGLATLDVDVLVALGAATGTDLGPLPNNVRVEAFVDQPAVLAHADLAVHHGGTGTTLAALGCGTPQLLLPKGADQFFNADLMAAAELASVLEPSAVMPHSVATEAERALTHRRPAGDTARRQIAAMPHPADVLDELIARVG
jgi:UDP:flavonoid glycosyltransferase YjiC (YdhE family)